MTGSSTTYAILRDLRIGAISDYPFRSEPTGLTVTNAAGQSSIAGQDGARWTGDDILTPHVVAFEIQMAGTTTETQTLLDALKAVWGPVRSDVVTLTVAVDGTERLRYGRPRRCVTDLSRSRFGFVHARCTFEASDPRLYAATESDVVLGLTSGGGITFPVTFPATFGVGGDNDAVAENTGTFETEWTAAITGPITTPRLTLGSTLVLSSIDKSVLLNGSPRQSWITLPSRWWKLPAESNTIRFRAASGSGQCTFAWRSAWL